MSRQLTARDARRSFLLALAAASAGGAVGRLVPRAFAQGRRERADPPASVSSEAVLSPAGEPGQALVVSGVVFAADGTTPAPGVLLYAYHTDAGGLYRPNREPGEARLRGWVRTDERGRYRLRTIRPGSYPGERVPAHIHMAAMGAGYPEQPVDELWFEDDPLLGEPGRRRFASAGRFTPICRPQRDAAGVMHCTRDIRLQRS